MRLRLAEMRPPTGHCRFFGVVSSESKSRWQNVLGARSRRLARVICLTVLTSIATPAAAEWPPPQSTPIEALSEAQYWPNDPSYAYGAIGSAEQGKPGQWWLYSFVPARAPSALLLRQPGLASGLGVDAAWRYGIGRSNVILAVLDDGIDWLDPELTKRIVLNLGELVHSPPLHSTGLPCAPLVPSDPKSPRFDCSDPPDGELTIDDFREAFGWTPSDAAGPKDPNGNGELDLYDIVTLYQNQRDDDNNGLEDDIIGWNFVEGSALPNHLVTRHGTESALDAVADTNHPIGRAGVCPGCRLIPIRVSDQRGTDPQRLALGILYAASRGATVALVGHLPLGRSETLERAIQSATQRGMLVLFPQDGERQTLAPALFDLDSWLAVGGLTTQGDSNITTQTTSFVALDPCQAFAPGLNYVGAGPSCGRTAPSVVLGVAGLVASSGQSTTSPTKLTPLELASTLKWSADAIDTSLTSLIDVSTTTPQPVVRRINANAAVEAARAGWIAPELNIERPYWYDPVVLDRLKSPTSVVGRLSAVRADALELSISVAHGRNPSDTEFQVLSTKGAIDTKTAAPDGSTLATLDLRSWYEQTHSSVEGTADPGSVVTIRIMATAHYTKLVQGATIERSTTALVERKVVVLKDPDLLAGAPLRIGSTPTAPKLADVDGDTTSDIVVGTLDGRLMVLSGKEGRLVESTLKPIQTQPTREFARLQRVSPTTAILEGTPTFPSSLGHSAIPAAPAIADLDADGQPEIVAATMDGHIYVVHADGTSPLGEDEPIELPEVRPHCAGPEDAKECLAVSARLERGISSSPVIADMNGDGQLDIVVAAHDGQVHVYGRDGKALTGWPLLIGSGTNMVPGRLTQSPAVGDFDGDVTNDLLVTAGEERSRDFSRGTHVLVLGGRSPQPPSIANGWPVSVVSYDLVADRLDRSTPGASIDGSALAIQALLYGNSSQPFFLPLAPGATQDNDPLVLPGSLPSEASPVSRLDGRRGFDLSTLGPQSALARTTDFAPMLARPSIGDLDRDGIADVVSPGTTQASLFALRNNSYSEHQSLLGMFSGETGRMLPAAPIALDDFVGAAGAAIADLTNDGFPEVIIANGSAGVLAVDACGKSAPGWPKVTGGRVSTTPAVGDIDGDGRLEVVVTTDDGWLYVWRTEGAADSYVPWASALNDSLNQSHYRPSTLPTSPKHPTPLRLDTSGRCDNRNTPPIVQPVPQLSARGGCSCRLLPVDLRSCPESFAAFIGAVATLLGRRRTRDRRPTGAEGRT